MIAAYREPRTCNCCEKPTDEGLVVVELAGEKVFMCFACKDELVSKLVDVRRPA